MVRRDIAMPRKLSARTTAEILSALAARHEVAGVAYRVYCGHPCLCHAAAATRAFFLAPGGLELGL